MDCVFGSHLGTHQPAISPIALNRSSAETNSPPCFTNPVGPPLPSLAHTPRITNFENKTSGLELKRERRRRGGGEPKDAYTQVRGFVDDFHQYRRGKLGPESRSPELYETLYSIRVTPKEFARLRSELKMDLDDDQRFPRYGYDSSTSTLIIQCMPSPVHESIVSTITDGFTDVKGSLPAPIRRNITAVANQAYKNFQGRYRRSRKIPDLAVEFTDGNGPLHPKFILEVGFSEPYEDLVQAAKLWLEGKPQVSVVMIVNFEESPPFRCPARDLDDEQLLQLQFPDDVETEWEQFITHNNYGPVTYRGLEWVGRFPSVFAEVWRRDTATGFATQSGNRVNLLENTITNTPPPELTFRLSEFLTVAPGDDRHISFRWDEYLLLFERKMKQLAVLRCQEMVDRRGGRTGSQDNDYPSPPSEASS